MREEHRHRVLDRRQSGERSYKAREPRIERNWKLQEQAPAANRMIVGILNQAVLLARKSEHNLIAARRPLPLSLQFRHEPE
jgi:hypothetical protein